MIKASTDFYGLIKETKFGDTWFSQDKKEIHVSKN